MEDQDRWLAADMVDNRGWAMRRGHCKALSRRRNPKAPCALRGRNAFSRTVNANAVRYKREYAWPEKKMMRQMQEVIVDSCMMVDEEAWDAADYPHASEETFYCKDTVCSEADVGEMSSDSAAFAGAFAQPSGCSPSILVRSVACHHVANVSAQRPDVAAGPPNLLRMRSTPHTAKDVAEAKERAANVYVPLDAWCPACLGRDTVRKERSRQTKILCKGYRWEEAAALAATAVQSPTTKVADEETLSKEQRRRLEWSRVQEERALFVKQREAAWKSIMAARKARRSKSKAMVLDSQMQQVQQHIENHQNLVRGGCDTCELEASVKNTFCCFQNQFLRKHKARILSCLSSGIRSMDCRSRRIDSPHELKPADLSLEVQLRFLKAWVTLGGEEASVRPVFHGTRPSNFDSIFARGLLIPGQGNELRVVHGSAHGLGIYTANLEGASLSHSFGGRHGMLVCAVLDDAVQLPVPRSLGHFVVTAESEAVRHIGHAVVVFDARRVTPLFQVSVEKVPRKIRLGRPDLCCKKEDKKKRRTAEVARRREAVLGIFCRRAARRRRQGRGLGRNGVGATGLASKSSPTT